LVRSPGIEPGSSAWEADVLPGWTKTAFDILLVLSKLELDSTRSSL
jgi:hypothetical protein